MTTISPLSFWEAYRTALISKDNRPADVLRAWTYWTCAAACRACEDLGLRPQPELQRIDVVGLRLTKTADQRVYGIAYEHEGGLGNHWIQELEKLWLIEADLRVLVGYSKGGMHPTSVATKLQEEIDRLRGQWPAGFGANWLFAFGVGDSRRYPNEPWNVWSLSEQGRLVVLNSATKLYPRQQILGLT